MKLALLLAALTAVSATAIPREAAADDTALAARALKPPFKVTAKTGLTCRKGPSSSSPVVRTYEYGAMVSFDCQEIGTVIGGNHWWDRVGGCYMADYYISTGVPGGNYPGSPMCSRMGRPNDCLTLKTCV